MPKYSKESLKQMAEEALQAKQSGDPRYGVLIMMMAMNTGLGQEAIEYKIKELSQ